MQVKSLKELIELASNIKSNIHGEYILGKLPPKQSQLIEQIIGYKLVGATRMIDSSGIKHALRKHGNEQIEVKHGQIAITQEDFTKVPLILKEPDQIMFAGKNRLNQYVFLYTKKIGVLFCVAEAIRFSKSGTKLVFQTMYKRK